MIILAQGCRNSQHGPDQAAAPVAESYPVFKAEAFNTVVQSEYPAMLQGQQNIEIRPKIDGYIEHIYIDEGATVKKGQLLFKISAPQYEQDVKRGRHTAAH